MGKAQKAAASTEATADWDTAPAETTLKANDNGTVRVKCIVKTQPWNDKGPMNNGDEADVPLEVAVLMEGRGQVVVL